MKPERLAQLRNATELEFLAAQKKIQPILDEERRVRGQLARIRAQEEQNRSAAATHTIQSSGAEIAWRAWLSKSQRELNIELAQILARKLPALDNVRKAFGRKEAVAQVVQAAQKERKRAVRKKLDLW